MERYRVVRIEEQMYGCEELPEGAEVCCDVTVEAADGTRKTLSCPDAELCGVWIESVPHSHAGLSG